MVAVVGIILEAERVLCVDDTKGSLGYFAGLFELLGVFSMGAFGFGLAVYFSDDEDADSAGQLVSANNRKDISSMIAVANLVYVLGTLLVVVELYLDGKICDFRALTRYVNMVMFLFLTVIWFCFAHSTMSISNHELMVYSLTIGVLLFIVGVVGGILKCLDTCGIKMKA